MIMHRKRAQETFVIVYPPVHLATIITIPFGLPSIIDRFLLVINVAVPAQDLPLELLCVLVPELCSLPI
jgi:hypothetical protein